MAIGKRIESAMIRAGKKPVDVAKRLKISESAVSQWFAKDTGPKSVRLSELASFLGTTVDYLISEPRTPLEEQAALPPMTLRPDRPDLAVYASAAGGPEGAWVLSPDAIAWIHRDQRLVGVRDAFACTWWANRCSRPTSRATFCWSIRPCRPMPATTAC